MPMRSPILCGAIAVAGSARAEPAVVITSSVVESTAPRLETTASAPAEPARNALYVELLGKAGPYGVGYERRITDRLWLGFAASYASIRQQQLATGVPYLHARLLGGRDALFGELGAIFAHTRIPSPVPEWNGTSDTGGGGFAAVGWQHSWRHLMVRAHGSLMIGEGGVSPWGGVALGVIR